MNKTGSFTVRFVLAGLFMVIVAGIFVLYGMTKETSCASGSDKVAGRCLPAGQCMSADGLLEKCTTKAPRGN